MLLRTIREFSLSTRRKMLRKTISILPVLAFAFFLNACNSKPSTHTFKSQRVTMRKFAIDPDVIRVKQGEDVVLTVSTDDVQHGFDVEDLGINEPVQPGKPVEIHLDTSKKGEFKVACSIICGPGHNDMTGKIVVE